jgi:hypothetical protein
MTYDNYDAAGLPTDEALGQPPLTDLLAAHREKAEAAHEDAPVTQWWSDGALIIFSGAGNVANVYTPERAAHIAANDPDTVLALLAVAEAANAIDGEYTPETRIALRAALDNIQEVMSRG